MNTVPIDFCERVFHLLGGNTLRAIEKKLSQRVWAPWARDHLRKRGNYGIRIGNPKPHDYTDTIEEVFEKVRRNSFFRITRITLGPHDQVEEIFDMALPYIAYEDDSSLNIETLPQPSYTNILEKIYASNRQFTCLDLQYVSDISTNIVWRHKERGVLKRLTLREGWPASSSEWIEELLHQHQFTFFCASFPTKIMFDKPKFEKLIEKVFDGSKRRGANPKDYHLRTTNFSEDEFADMMKKFGFRVNASIERSFIRGAVTVSLDYQYDTARALYLTNYMTIHIESFPIML
ncbi:hypothetical protein QR680_010791 [Steinernema hermaphroditum]|uniref:F-box domain-containing protein n=1 Tax=Steinernema hermaphroditum TaxID=289476 RepID=A0AA39MBS2_9BILA|nr:hypothetical protein QR680_010791 [Steinernema hermaphroditum]